MSFIKIEEFLKLSGLSEEKTLALIKDGQINAKEEDGTTMIDVSSGTNALIAKVETGLMSMDASGGSIDPVFVEKTIGTILSLHKKVIESKDETISAVKNENGFLKETLMSLQEVYDDDKKTLGVVRNELAKAREEIEFMKRKYKLMWGRVANVGSKDSKKD